MSKNLFIFIALLAATAQATTVKKCKSGKDLPFPLSVEVEGCDKPPCKIVKGDNVSMHIKFANNKDVSNDVVAKVRAFVLNVPVNYDLPQDVSKVCSNLENGASCPLQANQEAVYNFKFLVSKHYPDISADIEVSLVNQNKEVLSCFVCPIKVKKRMSPKFQQLTL